jgi:hypothetical protein
MGRAAAQPQEGAGGGQWQVRRSQQHPGRRPGAGRLEVERGRVQQAAALHVQGGRWGVAGGRLLWSVWLEWLCQTLQLYVSGLGQSECALGLLMTIRLRRQPIHLT